MASWGVYTLLSPHRRSKLWCALAAMGVVGCLDPLVEDPGATGELHQWDQSGPGIPEVPGAPRPGAAAPNSSAPTAGENVAPASSVNPEQPVAPGVTPVSPPTEGEPDAPSGTPTAVAPANTATPEPAEPSPSPIYGETTESSGADGTEPDDAEDDEFAAADGGVEAGSRLLIRAPQADAGDADTAGEGEP